MSDRSNSPEQAAPARLHSDFKTAAWRGTTNTDGKTIGLSFDLPDGSIARFALDLVGAVHLAQSILEFVDDYAARTNSHSESSSGRSSAEASATAPGIST